MTTDTTPNRNPYAKMRETYTNAGKSWSKVDDEEISKLFVAGNSVEDLALIFGRSPNGVRMRLVKLGVLMEEKPVRA